ncbi:hypothetical protein [Francisella orientalis]|uniref:hypothetical protein n=2 Tax=Francisella orientalis TaxID=299583 RepID=UPI0002E29455|nr:hypothetical protein [Francisella orientalis]AHB99238.1 hypothetical protein M973_06625 [Francisella orientalis LADL 07-285A]
MALITTSVYAVPAKGTFTAESSCQAYISKNKMTNPDNTYVMAEQTYSIQEKIKILIQIGLEYLFQMLAKVSYAG